ncbi:hypothetical protein PHMEG_00028714, partial [Phytophthora megakarya]
FLSAQGCRGKNGICILKNLCHFKPGTLHEIVRDFIINSYAGLSADILRWRPELHSGPDTPRNMALPSTTPTKRESDYLNPTQTGTVIIQTPRIK